MRGERQTSDIAHLGSALDRPAVREHKARDRVDDQR
jgi:hypothetical protein